VHYHAPLCQVIFSIRLPGDVLSSASYKCHDNFCTCTQPKCFTYKRVLAVLIIMHLCLFSNNWFVTSGNKYFVIGTAGICGAESMQLSCVRLSVRPSRPVSLYLLIVARPVRSSNAGSVTLSAAVEG